MAGNSPIGASLTTKLCQNVPTTNTINKKMGKEANVSPFISKPILPAVKHKWVKDEKGKCCSKCGSRVNNIGRKYIEKDFYGISEHVSWYPRCQFQSPIDPPLATKACQNSANTEPPTTNNI